MRATQENHNTKGQLAHVEKEQVDIKADIKIIQHDIVTIKENMATKADILVLNHKIETTENKLEARIEKFEAAMKNDIGWLKAINIAVLATVLSIALAPVAQNFFKAPVQEVIPVISGKK